MYFNDEVGEILIANYATVTMGKDLFGLKSHEAVVIVFRRAIRHV